MMPDREKVKKGVWQCWLPSTEEEYETQCHDCPYYEPGITLEECMTALRTDVLAMLKEKEAVEPYQHDAVWLCGNCDKEVVGWDDDIDGKEYRYPFCRQCGRAVKWE